jgi:phosphatidylinositol glycan class W
VVWTVAHNVTILFCIWSVFYIVAASRRPSTLGDIEEETPPIFAAVNRHGLLVFILANLMTGMVNLSMDTLNATNTQAIAVIFLYLCTVGAVALVLEWRLGNKTKRMIKSM